MTPFISVRWSSAHANRLPSVRLKISKKIIAFKSVADWMFAKKATPASSSCDWCGEKATSFSIDDTLLERRRISLCDDCRFMSEEPFDAYDHVRDFLDPANHNVDAEKMEFWGGDD